MHNEHAKILDQVIRGQLSRYDLNHLAAVNAEQLETEYMHFKLGYLTRTGRLVDQIMVRFLECLSKRKGVGVPPHRPLPVLPEPMAAAFGTDASAGEDEDPATTGN